MKTMKFSFDTWSDWLACVDGPSLMPMSRRKSRTSSDSFAGVSYSKALGLARQGWPEGADRANTQADLLFNHVSSVIDRQDVRFDTEGHYIDVARFNNNEPECWGQFETVNVEGQGRKLVRILFNIGASCAVGQEVILAKGSATVALIKLLEYAGHRVELVMGEAAESQIDTQWRIKLKEFDQDLDINRLIFALAHPASHRRLWMSALECQADWARMGARDDYGIPVDLPADKGEIYIGASNSMNVKWLDLPSACDWIMQKLKEQGIEVKEVSKA